MHNLGDQLLSIKMNWTVSAQIASVMIVNISEDTSLGPINGNEGIKRLKYYLK